MHWVKSMFCWVSVLSVLKRCSSIFLIQAVIISHLKWGSILFPGLGECDARNCLCCSEHFWEDVSLTCCFQHVTCVFVGSFSSITSSQRYLSSLHMPFMSFIHAICHLSFTIRWPTPACSQLLTPVFSTHFLNFQTFSDLLPCYCSSLGGTCCEYSPIYLILFFKSMPKTFVLWYQERYHLLNGYTSDVLQMLPVVTNFFYVLFPALLFEGNTVCIHIISLRPFVLCVRYCNVNYFGKGSSLPRPLLSCYNNAINNSGGCIGVQSQYQEWLH